MRLQPQQDLECRGALAEFVTRELRLADIEELGVLGLSEMNAAKLPDPAPDRRQIGRDLPDARIMRLTRMHNKGNICVECKRRPRSLARAALYIPHLRLLAQRGRRTKKIRCTVRTAPVGSSIRVEPPTEGGECTVSIFRRTDEDQTPEVEVQGEDIVIRNNTSDDGDPKPEERRVKMPKTKWS
jgi:hypothetical protein